MQLDIVLSFSPEVVTTINGLSEAIKSLREAKAPAAAEKAEAPAEKPVAKKPRAKKAEPAPAPVAEDVTEIAPVPVAVAEDVTEIAPVPVAVAEDVTEAAPVPVAVTAPVGAPVDRKALESRGRILVRTRRAEILKMLADFGVDRLSRIPDDRLAEAWARLEAMAA